MQLYISADHVKMSYNEREIFSFERLEIHKGDRIGIVGLNGEGKTTLLNILLGKVIPEEGTITRYCEIGYYEQFDEQHEKLGMSGGENTKIRLKEALQKDGHMMFLDEPTSNLDMQGIKELRKTLGRLDTFLLISHERQLLDEFCNQIIEVEQKKVQCYKGNYSDYQQQKLRERQTKSHEYEQYINEKKRLSNVLVQKKKRAHETGKSPRNISPREARLRNFLASRPYDVKQKAMEKSAKAVQSRLEHLEVKEKPNEIPKILMDFSLTNPPQNKRIMEGKGVSFSYGTGKVLDQVEFRILNGHHYGIVGANGAGKTTFLNCISSKVDGVYTVPKARLGYLYQQFESLMEDETVLYNMMHESIQTEAVARNILARLLLGEQFMQQKVKSLSGGERMKLALAKLLVSEANVLLLDEPTNYLDMPSVEAISDVLKEYEGTLLVVSHDQVFLNEVVTDTICIENHSLKQFAGNYAEYLEFESRDKKKEEEHIRIQSLEMEMVALVSKLSIVTGEAKEELERKYEQTLRELKILREHEA